MHAQQRRLAVTPAQLRLVGNLVVAALALFILFSLLNRPAETQPPVYTNVGFEGFDDDDGGGSYGALLLAASRPGTSRRPLQPNEMCGWETSLESVTYDRAVEQDGWPTRYEHTISESRPVPHITCPICGAQEQTIHFDNKNLREEGRCPVCGGFNRLRQIAEAALPEAQRILGQRLTHVAELAQSDLKIYNTQCMGVFHKVLRTAPGYVCSEFVSSEVPPGAIAQGVRHEDLQRTSFKDDTFDLVISGEVLSHVSSPYQAHHEIRRILKPGGSHIFTVPFSPTDLHDQVRASVEEGRLVLHVEPPIYAGDPRHKHGVLLYTIFGKETVDKMCMLGFNVTTHHMHVGSKGIVGQNAWVFVATKP